MHMHTKTVKAGFGCIVLAQPRHKRKRDLWPCTVQQPETGLSCAQLHIALLSCETLAVHLVLTVDEISKARSGYQKNYMIALNGSRLAVIVGPAGVTYKRVRC